MKRYFGGNNFDNKNRSGKGFTLPEVLLTVAILVVIFAVSIIAVSKFQGSLRQKELDSKAEVIYMTAQNRICELVADGRADLVAPSRSDVKVVDVQPVDANDGFEEGTLYYVESSAVGTGTLSTAAVLVPENRLEQEIRGNSWVVEYNPAGGSIYGVFYSEESLAYTPEGYNSLRIKKMRLRDGAKVGYYGGDFVATLDTATLSPQLTIYNEEKLYAIFNCVAPDGGNLEFDVAVSDSFGNKWTRKVGRNEMVRGKEGWVYELILDEAKTGGHFKDRFTGLVPGSDLTISYTARSTNDLIDEASVEAKTNSLFDSVEEGSTAIIRYCRHLQNLDLSSGLAENPDKVKITSAIQKSNLHFDNDAENLDDWYSSYGPDAYKPVDNPNIASYKGSYTLETAQGDSSTARSIIYGLKTEKGLFDTFYGHKLTDITLSGTAITGGEAAGAVAAWVKSTGTLEVSGCRVYLSKADGDLDDKNEKDVWIKGSKYAGGLFGHIQNNAHIADSFVASVVGSENTEYTGGLIGYVSDNAQVKIENSYGDCYMYGKSVGGLMGRGNGSTVIENCYTAGFSYASGESAGFVPGRIRSAANAYSALSYKGRSNRNYAICAGGATAKVYYIPAAAITDNETGEAVSYANLSNRGNAAANLGSKFTAQTGGSNTQAYNLRPLGLTDYSFPRLSSLTHYGDWEAFFETETPVYYERYKGTNATGANYGFFGANIDTLSQSKTAIGDGYGIVYNAKPELPVEVKFHDGTSEQTVNLNPNDAIEVTDGTDSYYLLKLPSRAVNTVNAPADFYQKIRVKNKDYYYNPHFSMTLTSEKPDKVDSVIVRTARQLYNMSLYYEDYAEITKKSVYKQELNIDYTEYLWSDYTVWSAVTSQSPIGVSANYVFDSIYDGGGKTIYGISFVNESKNSFVMGMFGENRGTLRNIAIVSEYEGSKNLDRIVELKSTIAGRNAHVYAGTLAGKNAKTIRNCAVAGYTFRIRSYENSSSYIGGLVGVNDGRITASSADIPVMTMAAHYADVRMGGFVGGNRNIIQSSYASAALEVTEAQGGKVDIAGFAGMNEGSIANAYCTASVITAGNAKGYGFAPAGTTIKNCYYLNDGTYFYVEKLTSFNILAGDLRVKAVKTSELEKLSLSGFSPVQQNKYNQKTTTNDSGKFPYPAVVSNAKGETIHYGNWVTEAKLGEIGVFYWEHEVGGTNAGYHVRYIGVDGEDKTSGSSLCTSHDDGGIVREYGYGYYIEKDETGSTKGSVVLETTGFAAIGTIDDAVSDKIEKQLENFKIHAYVTGTTGSSHLYLNPGVKNGTWNLKHTVGTVVETHKFKVNPFFANSFCFDEESEQTPGQKDNKYQIRSAMQLQYINWNSNTKNATSAITTQDGVHNKDFEYLVYVDGTATAPGAWNHYWEQTHDVNQESKPFTPIGSMHYTTGNEKGSAYIAYFGGSYDGKSYATKNIAIKSDVEMVGLFGITAGARLENIVMYSENADTIEITDVSTKWYCVGGLVGFAASADKDYATITNCTVSGYRIIDNRSHDGGWGGASVGGLAGACNMKISKCTAVNDIDIKATYRSGYNNIRVGGLVGNSRGDIDRVYCGGKITSSMSEQDNNSSEELQKANTNVWTGGIVGGIVMINFDNFKALVGDTTKASNLKNSYSYTTMPQTGPNQVRCSQSIASIGEMQSNSFTPIENPSISIYNCYAYEQNVRNTDDYLNRNDSKYWNGGWNGNIHTGKKTANKILLFNKGESPYVTYDQLSARSGETGSVVDLLNTAGDTKADFGFVTTEENGARIEGKYSYPGNNISLEGNNYPFPTILKQTDTLGREVNVHYGSWPNDKIYWKQPRISFDLLEMYDNQRKSSGISIDLFAAGSDTINPAYTYLDESKKELEAGEIAINVGETKWNAKEEVYNLFISGIRAGTEIVRAELNGGKADLMVNVTARMILEAKPPELEIEAGSEGTLYLSAASVNGKKDFTKDVGWNLTFDDENIAIVKEKIFDAQENKWKIVLLAEKPGEAALTATAEYRLVFGDEEKVFTENTVVLVRVKENETYESENS